MADYFVAVSVTRTSFDGYVDNTTKTVRVTAGDPVSAGEQVLDKIIRGPKWMYTTAMARVSSFESGELLATVRAKSPKHFGLPRRETADLWETSSGSGVG